ncbi:MAG: SAM-dependent methyltransferase [Gammaproteobacteria bacterium]|nr:SAM-dependent methyltransferase [Gammaproteobacteria bacterium]NNL51034.1 SAM-dependent methyltransferase [Woeseiaceae bacterium]
MQHDERSTLPGPDAISAEHSERVATYIRGRMADAGGSLSFADFMHQALYAPGLGYYAAGSVKFGADGDFVTAPEVSPVFGRVLARQCAEVLRDVDRGSILEYGAGSGRLARDILETLAELDALPERYEILEVSADLQERQHQYLSAVMPELVSRVSWLDSPPENHTGVVLANEVLDALPVERFVRRAAEIRQLRVVTDGDAFAMAEAPAPETLSNAVLAIEHELGERLPDGFVSDVSLGLPGWLAGLADSLQLGLAFLFDYGVTRREYYAHERSGGWLRCHFRHHAHNNPLILAGIQDLTAWVDFSAVAEAALSSGLDVAGYTAQAQFLLGGGLDAEMQDFASLAVSAQLELSGQIKTLTLPGEMGEHFKCMALRRGDVKTPSAFALADRTHTL